MDSKHKLKEIDIKDRTYYYFDDIIKVTDINFRDILLNEKPHKNTLCCDVSQKKFHGCKTTAY